MRLPSLRKLSPVFTLAVFGFAIYAITLELKRFSLAQISESFLAIEPWKLLVAACLVPPGLCALASYDLVAAADVLCYFGDLDTVLRLWAAHTAPGGDAIFSCERVVDDDFDGDWKLGPSGRYAHRPAYVGLVAEAAGFDLVSATDIVPRIENGNDVPGTIYVLNKKG